MEYLELMGYAKIDTDLWTIESEDAEITFLHDQPYCMEMKIVAYRGNVTAKPAEEKMYTVESVDTPELIAGDLQTISKVMAYLEDISNNINAWETEIRVRLYEDHNWVVIGWTDSGDPAILRFEVDVEG